MTRADGRPDAVARYATPRNPRRETMGPKIVATMRQLGWEPMPWQIAWADVAGELLAPDEDDYPGFAYDEVGLCVPRQSGKTTCQLGTTVHRAAGFPSFLERITGRLEPTLSSYTCQSKKDGLIKFLDDQLPVMDRSPFKPLYAWRGSHGMEVLKWRNGSQFEILPPTKDAGHGRSRDFAWVDEIWDFRTWDVEQGLKPAQITRKPWAQYVWSSTVGDYASTYLNEKMELGRIAVDAGIDRGLCYLEFSALPSDDPDDEELWWRTMPALGYTQTLEGIRASRASMEVDEFCRAFLNIPKPRRQRVAIPVDVWARTEGAERITGQSAVAISTGPDRSSGAIARAGYRDDGLIQLVVNEHRPGVGWIPGILSETFPGGTIVVDRFLDGSLVPDLERAGLATRQLGTSDVVNAYAKLLELLNEGRAVHAPQASLDDAAANATTRAVRGGDGSLFKRMGAVDISPLVAASLALWALVSEPPPRPKLKAVN